MSNGDGFKKCVGPIRLLADYARTERQTPLSATQIYLAGSPDPLSEGVGKDAMTQFMGRARATFPEWKDSIPGSLSSYGEESLYLRDGRWTWCDHVDSAYQEGFEGEDAAVLLFQWKRRDDAFVSEIWRFAGEGKMTRADFDWLYLHELSGFRLGGYIFDYTVALTCPSGKLIFIDNEMNSMTVTTRAVPIDPRFFGR